MATSKLKRFGIPTVLVVGGVAAGSLFAPLGLASAQEDETDSGVEPADSNADTPESDLSPHRRLHRLHGALHLFRAEAVSDALGMTPEEVAAGLDEGKTVAELAEDNGVSREELTAALVESITDAVDQAVENGRIDADRAAERLADVEARVTEFIDKDPSEIHRHGDGRGPGEGADRGPGQGADHGRGFGKLGGAAQAVEDLLGLSSEEIRAELADGRSLAELAEQQGVSIDELTEVLVADATERIDQAVEDGKIDADRAEEFKARLDEKVENGINAEFDGSRRGGHRGDHGHFGRPGDADTGSDTQPESSVERSSF